jgi:hypothetical protein
MTNLGNATTTTRSTTIENAIVEGMYRGGGGAVVRWCGGAVVRVWVG